MRRPSAEEMLNHPWMQSLRLELAEVENDGDGIYQQQESPDNSLSATAQPDLARAAHLMEERQMEDILSSPPEELDSIL